ncbi:hypothetical protein ACTHOQ_05760 [Solibacillus silvestris]|uniref:hypothetical protein n=1 Tax=Solibacillus silvestris TaxID=76853 RepID=UPI003F821F32
MKKWLFMIFIVVLAGCQSQQQTDDAKFIEALNGQGIPIKATTAKQEQVFTQNLNGQKPKTYLIDGKLLAIYSFERSADRSKAELIFHEKTAAQNIVSYEMYRQDQLLIFYVHEQNLAASVPYDEQIQEGLKQIKEGE